MALVVRAVAASAGSALPARWAASAVMAALARAAGGASGAGRPCAWAKNEEALSPVCWGGPAAPAG